MFPETYVCFTTGKGAKKCSRVEKNEGPIRKKIHRNREIAGVKTVGGWEHMGS